MNATDTARTFAPAMKMRTRTRRAPTVSCPRSPLLLYQFLTPPHPPHTHTHTHSPDPQQADQQTVEKEMSSLMDKPAAAVLEKEKSDLSCSQWLQTMRWFISQRVITDWQHSKIITIIISISIGSETVESFVVHV